MQTKELDGVALQLGDTGWSETEEIAFKHPSDTESYNSISIFKGHNNTWAYGLTHKILPGPTIAGGLQAMTNGAVKPDRLSCIQAASIQLKNILQDHVSYAVKYPDPASYSVPYMNTVIKLIDEKLESLKPNIKEQLTFF